MSFKIAYHTDVGRRKKTNQDAILIKTAQTPEGQVGIFVVCDGMGGLSQGEIASATVIRGLSDWFDNQLPILLLNVNWESEIRTELEMLIKKLNEKINRYGHSENIQLGTTVTSFLVIYGSYYILQIGDSRAYQINHRLKQLTKDQTLVAREIERGNLSKEQAKYDSRRNVLLQCVGATKELDIVITREDIEPGAMYMLCTDGFYHKISEEELEDELSPYHVRTEAKMKEKAIKLVELVKQRNELDNITVILTQVD